MAQIPSEVLANIRQYARRTRNAQQSQMELDESSDSKLEARLDQTIKELQMRVNEQRDQLEKVSAIQLGRTYLGPNVENSCVQSHRMLCPRLRQATRINDWHSCV